MFNIFKKNKAPDENSPAREAYENAKTQFEKEEFSAALGTLIGGFSKDINYTPLYILASQCLAKLGGTEESQLFSVASKNLNLQSFKKLGTHFYKMEHYPLTKIFLQEVFETDKDTEIANMLAIAYARRFDIKKAQETLDAANDKSDFWTFWFYVKTKILNNDQVHLEQYISQLEQAIDMGSKDEQHKIPIQKVRELRESFNRLQSIEAPENIIRDWHYIQYGSVILDFFFDKDQYVAGGRHVASWGNPQAMCSILKRAQNILAKKEIHKIIYGNTRDSKILGLSLAKIMNLPAENYNAQTAYANCVLFCSESDAFNEFNNVEQISNNNVTFAYNHYWLKPNFICPDIIGLMSQSYTFPWNGGGIKLNDDGTPGRTEADNREELSIAEEISTVEITEIVEVDPFYFSHYDSLQMNQTEGHRYNFMVESPIPGSYFGSN